MSIKVVAFNGSARKDGNTAILVQTLFKELEKAGIETELVPLPQRRCTVPCLREVLGNEGPGAALSTITSTNVLQRWTRPMDHPCVAEPISQM